jgi:hypothetical protein
MKVEIRRNYQNMLESHSSLGYIPPAPATIVIQPSRIQQVSLTL